MNNITFSPIGHAVSEFERPQDFVFACENGLKTENTSVIVIDDKYSEGLNGLEEFSHIFVIYFLDKAEKIELTTHPGPPSVKNLPRVGVFASRSQYRPNPIALRLVRLIKVEENKLYVEGLDAANGSPVLDIKPYVAGFDRPENFKTASWYGWLG